MPAALAVSPHLDDVAFSCGGLVARLAGAGWRVSVATVFSAGRHPAEGFALACQTDKGLDPAVDYMALRREEDRGFAAATGARVLWLGHLEAPHRGYASAPALFAPPLPHDDAWRAVAADLRELMASQRPELVLAPLGLGGHVDHLQVVRALEEAAPGAPVARYRDTPYALRDPGPADGLVAVPIDGALGRKLDGAAAYASQLGFQFGGAAPMRAALTAHAAAEARAAGLGGHAERFAPRGDARAVLNTLG